MDRGHEFLAPSSAGLTVYCHAAPKLQEPFPDDDTPAATEGRAAHWVVAEHIADRYPAVGSLTPEGVAVTQEMVEGAELVCGYLQERFVFAWRHVHVERKLHGVHLHPTKNGGTSDINKFIPGEDGNRDTLVQIDYKFGHAFVDEYECWQNINYASLILEDLHISDMTKLDVELVIIQPRCYSASSPIRTWHTTGDRLIPYFDRLRQAYHAATEPDPLATPGPWCNNQYCRARHACTALQQSAYFAAEESRVGALRQLTPQELGVELVILESAKARLDARIDGLKEEALAIMGRGVNVPHYIVEHSAGRTKWKKSADEIIMLGELMGVDLQKPPETITPFQARKLGLPEKVIKEFSETPTGAATLARDTKLQARRIFS